MKQIEVNSLQKINIFYNEKFIFSTIFLMAAFFSFASNSKLKKIVNAPKVQAQLSKQKIVSEVHMSGTMTSSCGTTWNMTYDCYSGCTAMGTLNNLATMQTAINGACSSGASSFSWEFPNS